MLGNQTKVDFSIDLLVNGCKCMEIKKKLVGGGLKNEKLTKISSVYVCVHQYFTWKEQVLVSDVRSAYNDQHTKFIEFHQVRFKMEILC